MQERCLKRGEPEEVCLIVESSTKHQPQPVSSREQTHIVEVAGQHKKTEFCLRQAYINIAGRVGQDSAPRKTACYSREHKHCKLSGNKIKRRKLKWRKVIPQDKHENKIKDSRRH